MTAGGHFRIWDFASYPQITLTTPISAGFVQPSAGQPRKEFARSRREKYPVRCLTIVVYGEKGKRWHFEKTFNPSREEIVAAIDRLDKFRQPWVWLFIGDEDEDASVDCLTIMGGDGFYRLALTAGKYDQRRLFDPNKGSHEVPLWTSDQGFADQEMHVTYDRESC